MRRFIICMFLVFSLCMSISCQVPESPDSGNEITNQQGSKENGNEVTKEPDDQNKSSRPYLWEEYSTKGGLSSNAVLGIKETNLPSLTYGQLYNLELGTHYKMERIFEEDEGCIVVFGGDNEEGKISHDEETFSLTMGIGVTPLHQDYAEKYGGKVDRIVMTITIDGVTHTMVENSKIDQIFVSTQSYPIFDGVEGNVSHVRRFSFPEIGVAKVPLSLFDFTARDSIEVTVNAVFYAGNEVVPTTFAPCTFTLKKTADGYQFVGTDQPIQGYTATKNMNCISE